MTQPRRTDADTSLRQTAALAGPSRRERAPVASRFAGCSSVDGLATDVSASVHVRQRKWAAGLKAEVALAVPLLLSAVMAGTVPLEASGPEVPEYALTVWSGERGAPPGDVFAITQDAEGYLWLGTPTGLVRFNGLTFTRWPPPDAGFSLPDGPVGAIADAPDGSLWIGFGGGGGVVHLRGNDAVHYSDADGGPRGVTAMILDRQGAIWVAARRGLFRFFDDRWTRMGEADGYPGAEAFSLYEDRAGRLWAGTAAGVYRRTNERFDLVDAAARNVQSLAEDASGAMWVTDLRQIVQRLPGRQVPKPGPSVRLPSSAWRVLHDRRGQLWIAAFGGGLMRVHDTSAPQPVVERFEYEHRLAGSPRSLYEDREHNIWVGMRGGLLRLSESAFASVHSLKGLSDEGVRTATVGPDGSVWVATGHALNRFAGASHQAYDVSQTMALHVDRHGDLWVSTSQAIGRLVNGRVVPIPVPEESWPPRVMAVTTDATDRLWLCSSLKGVSAWDGGRLLPFHEAASVVGRSCQSIYTDRQDRVWMGFLGGGVAVYQHGTFRSFGERDGVTAGTVLAILEDRAGAIWFATSTGVSRYQNGRFTSITGGNAPLADVVPVLVEDEAGYLWVGVHSGAGILRFHPTELDKVAANPEHRIEYALFDESDGLQRGSQTWQAGVGGVRGGDGRLWVATGLGVAIIDPRSLPPARRLLPPRIVAVTVDGRRLTPQPEVALPPDTSTIVVRYEVVSLSSAAKLQFRYRLEGLDDDWIYAGDAREATYSSVSPGTYRFRVSATDNGRWTEAVTWSFTVAPPFYLTRSFLIATAAGVSLLLVAAWWLRLRAVRHQYALVFAERARVGHEIHDTLLQSLAAIGIELEIIATQLDPAKTPAREAIHRLRRQVSHSLREARESILELRHRPLKLRVLADSLREVANMTSRTKGVRTEFTLTGRPRPTSTETDVQLLRIGQEAVNNAVRHARATCVRIALAYGEDRVVLRVSDDGCGFVPEECEAAPASGEHLGLVTMRERAARVRGRVAIQSHPGGGTTVETTVSLAPTGVGENRTNGRE